MSAVCLIFGLALLAALWSVPMAPGFTAHMLRHMALVALVPPLIVIGLPALRGFAMPALAAALVEFAVVWGWHLPVFHEAAQVDPVWFAAEQGSFLLAGLAVWGAVLRPGAELAGAGGLLLTSMHMTLLGALLILAARPLYGAICYGGDALWDQQMGGMVMLGIGMPVYLVAGLLRVRQVLGEEGAPS